MIDYSNSAIICVKRKTDSSELCHGSKQKHKYIARVKGKNGKYRYFYDKDEYRMYLFGKKLGDVKSDLTKKANKIESKLSKKVDSFLDKKKDQKIGSLSLLIKKKHVKKAVSFIADKLGITVDGVEEKPSKIHKYIAKVKTPSGKYRYFYDQDEYNAYLERLEYQKNEPDFMKKVPDIHSDDIMSASDDQAEINEKLKTGSMDYMANCMYCTTAYELRRRGYDVEAGPNPNGATHLDLATWYENPQWTHISDTGQNKDFTKYMKDQESYNKWWIEHGSKYNGKYSGDTLRKALEENNPPNSRGNLMVYWKQGSGHSMVYETDSNGKVIVRDCQTNEVRDLDELANSVRDVNFIRTDNLELKQEVLSTVERN